MQKTIKLSSAPTDTPIELQHLRAVVYCRVSTDQEGHENLNIFFTSHRFYHIIKISQIVAL